MIIKLPQWTELITVLKEKDNLSMYKLNIMLNRTYSHTFKLIKEMEKYGWVKTYIEGKERRIELTQKGKHIKNCVVPIIIELNKLA